MLHYHGGPCSGPASEAGRFYRGRHIMVSFAHPDHLPAVAESAATFALDNGAFSEWRSTGKAVDFDAYREWVGEWHRHPGFDFALIPDTIDGDAADNDELVKRWAWAGLPGVPVWHLHEPVERLQALAAGWPLVALGSSGKFSQPGNGIWWERMHEALAAVTIGGRPTTKLHGLRMLNPEVFTRIPFRSADSTNACQNAGSLRRFGQYAPPSAWQRAAVIADRIEGHNSPAVWEPEAEPLLF
jgi:hypothetical protein